MLTKLLVLLLDKLAKCSNITGAGNETHLEHQPVQ